MFIFFMLVLLSSLRLYGKKVTDSVFVEIGKKIPLQMKKGEIPGLVVVVIKGNEPIYVKGFGYADLSKKTPVTETTLFELSSCSNSFTALGILRLEAQGLLHLDDPVTTYFPGFYVTYNQQKYPVTIRQLLHHTSGIPGETHFSVPSATNKDTLEQTIPNITGIQLNHLPGQTFQYAAHNYDILGAIIERVTGMPFEKYMLDQVFKPLALNNIVVKGQDQAGVATGYKIGFFAPRPYHPPVYRSNTPAAYILSNGKDMSRWLKLQMNLVESRMSPLIQKTQIPDTSVRPDARDISFAMGWFVNSYGEREIFHYGQNPTFTAVISIKPEEKIAVAVMANSNSHYSLFITETVMKLLGTEKSSVTSAPGSIEKIDKAFSVVSLILGLALLMVVGYLVVILVDLFKGNRRVTPMNQQKSVKLLLVFAAYLPFLLGVYWFPATIKGFSWPTAIVWLPVSFTTAVYFFLAFLGLTYLVYALTLIMPHKNKYRNSFPLVVGISILPGIANATAIFILTNSFQLDGGIGYMVYYFASALFLYVLGYKIGQTELIRMTNHIILDLRMKLIEKIFNTTYEKFEKIDRGRVYATLDNDIGTIGRSIINVVNIITGLITITAIFVYLGTISLLATLLTLSVVTSLFVLYYITSKKTNIFFEESRETRNVFMRLIDGLLNGYKELRLHRSKMLEYEKDIRQTSQQFCQKNNLARIKFINVDIIGQSMIIVVLGAVCFTFPLFFPGIGSYVLMSYVMVLLYLIGPITSILNAMPSLMELKVSWKQVQGFIRDVPASTVGKIPDRNPCSQHQQVIEKIEARGVIFQYQSEDKCERFTVGPINFEAKKGEIIFIIGGNGSGKTTLAKLLTGLYIPQAGNICIDGKEVDNDQLGSYYSVVFSDSHLFRKLYHVNVDDKQAEIKENLKLLNLEDKVQLQGNEFSTIDLSGGQRKRLALLRCFIEDHPIYLFDEWAADQDPQFRKFFYRTLLKRMKKNGKIVIAITHDDHYFDVADKIIKMDMGKIDCLEPTHLHDDQLHEHEPVEASWTTAQDKTFEIKK